MSERRDALEAVDWSSLTDAKGSAARVPSLLSAMWSSDEDSRRAAYNELAGRLVEQGHPVEASAVAVPFVVDVVADPKAPDRFVACLLLRYIAVGHECDWLSDFADLAQWRQEMVRVAGSTVQELLAERARWAAEAPDESTRRARERGNRYYDEVQAGWHRRQSRWSLHAYDAVRAGVPVYVAALDSADPELRLHAAQLLAWFPEEAATIAPALVRLLAREQEPLIAGTACVAAGLCGPRGDQALIHAVAAWRDSADPVAHLGAVFGLAPLLEVPDRELLEELYARLFQDDTEKTPLPFLNGDASALAARTLSSLAPTTAADQVEILVGWAARDVPLDAASFVATMLSAAFGDQRTPDGATFADLRPEQQRALSTLLECGALDQGAPVSMLLLRHNLPEDPHELRRWCTRPNGTTP